MDEPVKKSEVPKNDSENRSESINEVKRDSVKAENTVGRGEVAQKIQQDQAAELLVNPEEEKLPDNTYSRLYYELRDQLKADPENFSPLQNLLLIAYYWAAKMDQLSDFLPGGYITRIKTKDEYKNEKFEDEEMEKIKKVQKRELPEPDASKNYGNDGVQKASTRYVSHYLLGINEIDDPNYLAAKMINSRDEEGKPYFKETDLQNAKKNGLPFGTVIIFYPKQNLDLKKLPTEKIVAYATGNEDEYKYYDPREGKIITRHLNEKGTNNQIGSLGSLLAIIKPTLNTDFDYFSKHPADAEVETDDINGRLIATNNSLVQIFSGTNVTGLQKFSDKKGLDDAVSIAAGFLTEIEEIFTKLDPLVNEVSKLDENHVLEKTFLKNALTQAKESLKFLDTFKARIDNLAESENKTKLSGFYGKLKSDSDKLDEYLKKFN